MSERLPPTEATNPNSESLDLLPTTELVNTIVADQRVAIETVIDQAGKIAQAVDAIAARLARGGSLRYIGAGTSGRIAALDAAEMPPTFGTDPNLVRAYVAGGDDALVRAVEGAEDAHEAGRAIGETLSRDDALIGISASGTAAFVIAAVERAAVAGAFTVALTSAPASALARAAELAIVLETGAEVLTGSTRLKAGTAQKIALNALSTAVMVRLGKVHGNLMVDVVASNRKLRARALRLVQTLADVPAARAQELLDAAGGRVKLALVMHRRGVSAADAQRLLDVHGGSLRRLG